MMVQMLGSACRGRSALTICRLSSRTARSVPTERSNTTTRTRTRWRSSMGQEVIPSSSMVSSPRSPKFRLGLIRLRLLNAANAQNFELRFSDRRTFHVIASDGGFLAAPVATTQLTISPAERFEVLVDFADGKAVALETGPDEELGVFGRVAPDGSADYVPIMQFEPMAMMPSSDNCPTRLERPGVVDPASTVWPPATPPEQRSVREPPRRAPTPIWLRS